MKQLSFACDPLQQIEKAGLHAVYVVGVSELDYAIGAAHGAAGIWTEMIAVAPRGKLLAFALTALVDRHVTEALQERPMDAPQPPTALPALHFRTVISQFAEGAQAEREWKNRSQKRSSQEAMKAGAWCSLKPIAV